MTKNILVSPANGFCGKTYTKFANHMKNKEKNVTIIPFLGHSKLYPIVDNWENQADELLSYIDQDKVYTAIGHSMGAIILLQTAAKYPKYFNKIILIDPPMAFGWNSKLFKISKILRLQDYFTVASKLKNKPSVWNDLRDAQSYFEKQFKKFDEDCLKDYLDSGLIYIKNNDQEIYRTRFQRDLELLFYKNSPDNLNSLPPLKSLGVEVVILTPTKGTLLPKSSLKSFIKKHSAKHYIIDGTHMAPLENPIGVAETILDML